MAAALFCSMSETEGDTFIDNDSHFSSGRPIDSDTIDAISSDSDTHYYLANIYIDKHYGA